MSNGPSLAAWLVCAVAAFGPAAAAQAPAPSRASLVALTEVADIEALALSPDGRRVAFRVHRPSVARNAYAIDWHVADLATGEVTAAGDGGEIIYDNGLIEIDAPVWAPDGRTFFRRALVDGAIGIWRTAADGSGSTLVIGGDTDVESIASDDDGRSLAYVTGPSRAAVAAAERAEYDEGILIDATVDTQQGLYRAAYSHGRLGTQRLTGYWFSRDGLLWREPRTRHRVDQTSWVELGRAQLPPPGAPAPALADAMRAIGKDGAVAQALNKSGGDPPELSVERSDGSQVRCAALACRSETIAAIVWRPGRDEVLFTRQDETFRDGLFLFDPDRGTVRKVFEGTGLLSGGRNWRAPCAVSQHYAVCVEAGASSPPRLVRIALDTGRSVVLLDPNGPLRARPAPRVEHLAVPLGEGRTQSGVLLTPPTKTAARLPLFVMFYHCPGYLRGGMGDEFPFGPLVEGGFAVVCLNLIRRLPGETAVDDYRRAQAGTEAVIDALDRRGLIDPARVGMGGLSFGSEVTMWMAMKTRRLSAAAVASPQPSPTSYWMRMVRGRDSAAHYRSGWGAGSPDDNIAAWREFSPELNVDKIKAPLLMQLPEQEYVAALPFYARLTHTPTPVELFAYPHESHTKLQPRHRYAVYRRYLDWFRYWLQNYRDPDPAVEGQYRRWDALLARRDGSGEAP